MTMLTFAVATTTVGLVLIIIAWVGFSFAAAEYGSRNRFPFGPLFIGALLLSPVLVFLLVAVAVGVRGGRSEPVGGSGNETGSATAVAPLAIPDAVADPTQRAVVSDARAADTKNCPRCAETIKAAALVCRYCGHTFDGSPLQKTSAISSDSRRNTAGPDKGGVGPPLGDAKQLVQTGYTFDLLVPFLGLVLGVVIAFRNDDVGRYYGWRVIVGSFAGFYLWWIGLEQGFAYAGLWLALFTAVFGPLVWLSRRRNRR